MFSKKEFSRHLIGILESEGLSSYGVAMMLEIANKREERFLRRIHKPSRRRRGVYRLRGPVNPLP